MKGFIEIKDPASDNPSAKILVNVAAIAKVSCDEGGAAEITLMGSSEPSISTESPYKEITAQIKIALS